MVLVYFRILSLGILFQRCIFLFLFYFVLSPFFCKRMKVKYLIGYMPFFLWENVGNFYQEKMYGIFNAYFLSAFQYLWFRVLLRK